MSVGGQGRVRGLDREQERGRDLAHRDPVLEMVRLAAAGRPAQRHDGEEGRPRAVSRPAARSTQS